MDGKLRNFICHGEIMLQPFLKIFYANLLKSIIYRVFPDLAVLDGFISINFFLFNPKFNLCIQ